MFVIMWNGSALLSSVPWFDVVPVPLQWLDRSLGEVSMEKEDLKILNKGEEDEMVHCFPPPPHPLLNPSDEELYQYPTKQYPF